MAGENAGIGLTLIKQFTYRGDATEQWSNTYWLNEPIPVDDASWQALFDKFSVEERKVYLASSSIVRAYGYNDRTYRDPADWVLDLQTPAPGTLAAPVGDAVRMAGDQAAFIEFQTRRKSNPGGKWVYLRKYFHDGLLDAQNPDNLEPGYHTALITFADWIMANYEGLLAGPSKDNPTPVVDTIQAVKTSPFVTTRTLKRRGRRPRPASSPGPA